MRAEGLYVLDGKSNEKPPEPEEDFGGGGGGCTHPECAVEHMIDCGLTTIMEGLNTFAYAEWEISEYTQESLKELGRLLTSLFDGENADSRIVPFGEIFMPERKEDKRGD